MNNTKFTPGPWRIDRETRHDCGYSRSSRAIVDPDGKQTVEDMTAQEILDSIGYSQLRAIEYPSYADQFDILYHGGYDAWKAEIDKIKNKYPKPQ